MYLPPEVVAVILQYVDVLALPVCRFVCRQWSCLLWTPTVGTSTATFCSSCRRQGGTHRRTGVGLERARGQLGQPEAGAYLHSRESR